MLKNVRCALRTSTYARCNNMLLLLLSLAYFPFSLAGSDLEEVIVSLPLQDNSKDVARAVTVLSDKELHQRIASTLGETLSQMPGISSASFGTGVGQPVIRGQQGARVTVLRNGTSVADASNLSVDHAIVVEPAQAQSIEVLRGPAALLYGGGAIGGIVNVIDERIPQSSSVASGVSAEVRHGSVNDETVSVMHGTHVTDSFGFHVDGVYRESNEAEIPGRAVADRPETEGRLLNSAGRASNYALGVSRFLENGFVGLSYERSENIYGIPPSGEQLDEGELIDLDVEQDRYELRGEHALSLGSFDALRWQLTYSDYEHTEIASGLAGTVFSNENLESRVELLHSHNDRWKGATGLQLRTRNFAAAGDEAFVPRVDIESLGLFLLEQTTAGNANIELGLRYDYDSIETDELVDGVLGAKESFNSLNLSASSLWQLDEQWSAAVALSYAERGLAVEEIYANPSCDPDPDALVVHEATEAIEVGIVCNEGSEVEKEASGNIDLTLRFSNDKLDSWLTLFYNDFGDFVYLRNTGITSSEGVPVFQYTQADADFYGVEFESSLSLQTSDGIEHTLTLWGDFIRGQLSQGNEDLPRLPARRTGLRWNGEINNFSMFSSITLADGQDRRGADEEATSHFTRWDAGLEYAFDKSDVDYLAFLRFKNITDEEIRYATSFRREVEPQAGRSLEVGIRLSL